MWGKKLYFYIHNIIQEYCIFAFTVEPQVGTEVGVKVIKIK